MSGGARSVFVFSIYLYVLGILLVVIPETLVRIFRFPEADGLWIRIAGLLVIILGFYYSQAARSEMRQFFVLTVIGRTAGLLSFVVFVVAGLAPPVLIAFGIIDFATAMWTLAAIRTDTAAAS